MISVLALTIGITVIGIALAAVGAALGLWPWPPPASGPVGVGCGIAGAAIIFFEMALLPRKWFRGRRLGRTKLWMRWHVILGLACLPVILVHSSFALGGWLPAVTMVLFLLVIVSGVWGLIMQQWLPNKMFAEVPNETIAGEVDFAMKSHVLEATRRVDELISVPVEDDTGGVRTVARTTPIVVGPPADELVGFLNAELIPFLESGRKSGTKLVSRASTERTFARLRMILPLDSAAAVDRLENLCDLRRQWDTLRRLHVWLHNWILVHLPLSVAMTVLMVVHALRALKYW